MSAQTAERTTAIEKRPESEGVPHLSRYWEEADRTKDARAREAERSRQSASPRRAEPTNVRYPYD